MIQNDTIQKDKKWKSQEQEEKKDTFRTTGDARSQKEVFDFKWNIPTAQNIY